MSPAAVDRHATLVSHEEYAVVRMQALEAIDAPFEITLELEPVAGAGGGASTPFEELLGQAMCVRLETGGSAPRFFHGIVEAVESRHIDAPMRSDTHFEVRLVPRFGMLRHTRESCLFSDETIDELVTGMLRRHEIEDVEFRLEEAYEPLAYCVQYRESDFTFISRLLQEHGIHYFFEHEEDRHVLVFADTPSMTRSLRHGSAVVLNHDGTPSPFGDVRIVGEEDEDLMSRDVVTTIQRRKVIRPTHIRATDYNYETPNNWLGREELGPNGDMLTVSEYPGGYQDAAGAERRTQLRLQEQQAQIEEWVADSGCRHFQPGRVFSLIPNEVLGGSAEAAAEVPFQTYLIKQQRTTLDEGGHYSNSCRLHPYGSYRLEPAGGRDLEISIVADGAPYRPRRSIPRPVVRGVQTAVVVGPEGEDVHTDQLGRVQVEFHWDWATRKSCWVRVSQGWAGKNYGMFFLPRIGQEVIVDFIEGDPDRPIVTGRVHNAESQPPVDLPGGKTTSTIKTRSSPGGSTANFNEIRFEDRKGSERLFVQAERDYALVVKGAQSAKVGGKQTTRVDEGLETSAKTIQLSGDETIKITAKDEKDEKGGEASTIEMDYRTVTIKAGQTEIVMDACGKVTISSNFDVEVNATNGGVKVTGQTINLNC